MVYLRSQSHFGADCLNFVHEIWIRVLSHSEPAVDSRGETQAMKFENGQTSFAVSAAIDLALDTLAFNKKNVFQINSVRI